MARTKGPPVNNVAGENDEMRPCALQESEWGATPADNLKKLPCKPGGQLELLVSDALHGSKANWKQLPPLFTTNVTKSGELESPGAITGEFVTSGYFGTT